MNQEKRPGKLRLIPDCAEHSDGSTKLTLDPADRKTEPMGAADPAARENPLVRQLSALADSLDREVAMLLGF
jgi:hypothetical protein